MQTVVYIIYEFKHIRSSQCFQTRLHMDKKNQNFAFIFHPLFLYLRQAVIFGRFAPQSRLPLATTSLSLFIRPVVPDDGERRRKMPMPVNSRPQTRPYLFSRSIHRIYASSQHEISQPEAAKFPKTNGRCCPRSSPNVPLNNEKQTEEARKVQVRSSRMVLWVLGCGGFGEKAEKSGGFSLSLKICYLFVCLQYKLLIRS